MKTLEDELDPLWAKAVNLANNLIAPDGVYEASITTKGIFILANAIVEQDKLNKLAASQSQEPVAYGYANTAITGKRMQLMMVKLDNVSDQYPELAIPLYTTPPDQSDLIRKLGEALKSVLQAIEYGSAKTIDEIHQEYKSSVIDEAVVYAKEALVLIPEYLRA